MRGRAIASFGLAALLAACSQKPAGSRHERPAPTEAASFVQVPQKISAHVTLLRLPVTQFIDPTGNVVVIEQSGGLVLIDSGGYFGAGRRVVDMVKAISPKPVTALVLTHYHSDHSFGAAAVLAAWPGADFIASEGTLKAMAEGRPPGAPRAPSKGFEQAKAEALKDAFAQQAKAVADVKTAEERAGWKLELASLPQRLADIPGTYTVLPRHTFKDRLDLPDPVTPVQLLFLGRANTPGDTLAWLPSERILVAGDVLVVPIPYMFDVYPTEMLSVFQRMRALPFETIIPGHGEPQGRTYLDRVGALVRDVRDQAGGLARQGLTSEQVKARMDSARYRKAFAGNDPWLGFWFDNYTWSPLIDSVWHEAHGDPLGPPRVKPAT
jgi:glyoxylase-like metal-dependent hydrolase (beta-lactamase superfamily II)